MDEPAEDQPVISIAAAALITERNRQQGELIGVTNGCFDLFHEGHVAFLRSCAMQCSFLLVGLNSDESVRKLKGPTRPIVPQDHRLTIVQSCRYVGQAFIFDESNFAESIRTLRPMIWFKGDDYTHETLNPEEVKAAQECQTQICLISTGVKMRTTEFIHRIVASVCSGVPEGSHGQG